MAERYVPAISGKENYMAEEKQTEKEIEVKEFISKPAGGTNMKQKAARAKHSYMKKSMQVSLKRLIKDKAVLASSGYAVLAVIVILVSIFALKLPVVAVCSIVLIVTLLAVCLHNLPVWLHVLVVVAELLCGGYFDKILLMVLTACMYVAAILVLKVIRQNRQ